MPRLSAAVLAITLGTLGLMARPGAQTDLDAFMKDVVARRDDNWKKLQQYILDEREEMTLTGPGGTRMWGERREYTWFLRDGFFVRSPVKVDGATVSESDRRRAEDDYLRAVQRRERRGMPAGDPDAADAPTNVDNLIRQTRQPRFVSSSYFLRFAFDEGRYALVGRETFDGRDVLRIEYYPTRLFEANNRGNRRRRQDPDDPLEDAEFRRLMNKVALITLWVEPSAKQIVKYTFDNIDFDFLPVPSIVKVDTIKASMTMSQPFKDVWLPKGIDMDVALTLAIGQFEVKQAISYVDYREASVASKVIIPGAR